MWPFAVVSDFMAIPGANLLLAAIYKDKYNEYNKTTKNRVYDKFWLNKNIKAFYRKTWKLGDPTPLFASVYSSHVKILRLR